MADRQLRQLVSVRVKDARSGADHLLAAVPVSTSVLALKFMIKEAGLIPSAVPAERAHLAHHGRLLRNDETLLASGVAHMPAVVLLVPSLASPLDMGTDQAVARTVAPASTATASTSAASAAADAASMASCATCARRTVHTGPAATGASAAAASVQPAHPPRLYARHGLPQWATVSAAYSAAYSAVAAALRSARRAAGPRLERLRAQLELPAAEASAHSAAEPRLNTDDDDDDELQCRICFAGPEAGRLFRPCRCRGSARYVHVECLNSWRAASVNRHSFTRCEQCGYRYRLQHLAAAQFLKSEVRGGDG